MATQNIYNLTDTWNDGATTFNAIKMNVTDAGSASDSNLLDLQVNGSSQLKVSKSGQLTVGNSSGGGSLRITNSGGVQPLLSRYGLTGGLILGSTSGSTPIYIMQTDLALTRDSAGVLKVTDGSTGNGNITANKFNVVDGGALHFLGNTGYISRPTWNFMTFSSNNNIYINGGSTLYTNQSIIFGTASTYDAGLKRTDTNVLSLTDGSTGYAHLVVDTVRVNNPINTQTGVLFTPAVSDAERYIRLNNSAAITVSVPSDATSNIPVGTTITFEQTGTGTVTFVAGSGATLNSRDSLSSTVGQYSVASLIKTAANTFTLTGDLV